MASSSSCTVVIVGYQGERWLPGCLNTLAEASAESIRLVLVDNGGNGDLGALPLDKFQCHLTTAPRRLGFAEANNFALRQIDLDSEAVSFLNQDTLSQPGWLDACLACLRDHPDVGALSPLLLTYDGSGYDPGFRDCTRHVAAFPANPAGRADYSAFEEAQQVTAAAMVVRTAALRKSGPFDPIFGSYYEDYDLCRRIRLAGYRIGVCGRGAVWHYSGSSTTSTSAKEKRLRQIIRNRVILSIREAGDRRGRALARYVTCSLPHNLGRSLLGTPSSQPLSVQLAANWDLAAQWKRLLSARSDHRAWIEYLSTIDWPELCD